MACFMLAKCNIAYFSVYKSMLSGKPYKVRINKYSQIKQAVASTLVYRGYSIECVPLEVH